MSWNTLHVCEEQSTQLDQTLARAQSRVGRVGRKRNSVLLFEFLLSAF